MKLQRFDTVKLDGVVKHDGYLTVTAPITRPGVFPYLRADGTMQMEAKLPTDIFSPSVLETSKAKPVTNEHPPVMVTPDNYKLFACGTTHTDSRIEDDMVKISMTVTDPQLMDAILDGSKKELSIGFETDLVEERGDYGGLTYDCRQTNIKINHVAVVEAGRAGATVAIRGDSAAYMVDTVKSQEGGTKMPTVRIDGKEIEVASEVKSRLDALEAQLETATAKAATVGEIEGEKAALEAQLQAKDQELEAARADAMTSEKLDAAIATRLDTIKEASSVLGEGFDFKGLSDEAIKIAVVKKFDEAFEPEGKPEGFVDGFYKATIKAVQTPAGSVGKNTVFTGDSADTASDIAKMRADRLNPDTYKGGRS